MPNWIIQYLKSAGENFGQVTPNLYRSAELSASRLKELHASLGISVMLNLRDDLPAEEAAEIEAAGITLFRVPMDDTAAPTSPQIYDALTVLRFPDVKLICCKGGRHRTGLIVAVYRVVEQKWAKEAAWREANKFGWYDHGNHKPLRLWFEQTDLSQFKLADSSKPKGRK